MLHQHQLQTLWNTMLLFIVLNLNCSWLLIFSSIPFEASTLLLLSLAASFLLSFIVASSSRTKIMSSFIKESRHLTIPFRDIEAATKNFSTCIGKGGYGLVYEGELPLSDGLTPVAVKRLDGNISGQGFKEFLTEIQLLSHYKHPNLVSLLGFCEEGHEKILIYEYAEHGSLDMYIDMAKTTFPLTWKKRINICVDAARGLDYLHNHVAEKHRVIHRDIKSANILLDHNWKAMISDLGLSKIGRANENDTYLITNACGSFGYCDPAYVHTGVLTKESDVFSFGVVLFQVLCGRLCFMNVDDERRFLAPLAQSYCEKGKLHEIIDPDLRKQMNTNSLYTFSEIAYRCLHKDREKRPSMDLVVEKLVEALLFQEIDESDESKHNWSINLEEIIRMSDSPMAYTNKDELYSHLSKGVLVNEGSVWVSVDDNGETHEMLSAMKFINLDGRNFTAISAPESRFPMVAKIFDASELNIEVKMRTQFLSPGVTYAAYLVFRYSEPWLGDHPAPANLKYTLKEKNEMLFSYLADWRGNGWLMVELFQTINLEKNADFEVTLKGLLAAEGSGILVEGIEFLPIKKLGDEETEKPEVGSLPLSEIEWEYLLPSDYKQLIYYSTEEMMNMPYEEVVFPTKEEAYSLLCRGFHIYGMWFWLSISNGKKCFMVGAESLKEDINGYHTLRASHGNESRFEKIVDLEGQLEPDGYEFYFTFEIDSRLLSPKTIYACYLVYKLPEDFHEFEYPLVSRIENSLHDQVRYFHLVRPRSPVIGPNSERSNQATVNRPKVKGLPNGRKDDWWEVSLGEFIYDNEISDGDPTLSRSDITTITSNHVTEIDVTLCSFGGEMVCLTVQGIEFRPI